jgi:hypothetical protein
LAREDWPGEIGPEGFIAEKRFETTQRLEINALQGLITDAKNGRDQRFRKDKLILPD